MDQINKNLSPVSIEDNELTSAQKAISGITHSVIKVVQLICGKIYTINGEENIPHDQNFLLIANHPFWFDYFVIQNVLEKAGKEVPFFVHKGFLESPVTKGFASKKHLLGVRRQKKDIPRKTEGTGKYNLGSIRTGIESLRIGENLGIFISGQGHLKDMEKIFGGYKLIVKKLLQSPEKSILILPVVIVGNKVEILPPEKVQEYDDALFTDIEEKMKCCLNNFHERSKK